MPEVTRNHGGSCIRELVGEVYVLLLYRPLSAACVVCRCQLPSGHVRSA